MKGQGGILKRIPEEKQLEFFNELKLDNCFIKELHIKNPTKIKFLARLNLKYYLAMFDNNIKLLFNTCDDGTFVIEPSDGKSRSDCETISCEEMELKINFSSDSNIEHNCEFVRAYHDTDLIQAIKVLSLRVIDGEAELWF